MNHSIYFYVLMASFFLYDLINIYRPKDKSSRKRSLQNNVIWSLIWVALALLYNVNIYFEAGTQPAIDFFTCFVIEKLLSLDNLFVFIVIFQLFKVPQSYQEKLLFWGIIGAIILRIVFIKLGVKLAVNLPWIYYVFGILLILTAWRMISGSHSNTDIKKGLIGKFVRRFVSRHQKGHTIPGWRLSSSLIVMINIIICDIIFAVDSIPAALAITQEYYIVVMSNVFALLGQTALFFILKEFLNRFYYLTHGLSTILFFIGFKMILHTHYAIGNTYSLVVTILVLVTTIMMSISRPKREQSN